MMNSLLVEADLYRIVLGFVLGLLLIGPAVAETWGTYYNMDTFGAGGGTDEEGWFNFECASADSGFSFSEQPFFAMGIGETFLKQEATLEPQITIFVDDDQSYVVPMRFELNSTTTLVNDRDPKTFPNVLDLIEALRRGERATAWSGQQQLASVALDGSFAALDGVAACVAGET